MIIELGREETDLDTAGQYLTKTDWAYQKLHAWICSGALEAGERVDQERISRLLGISRVPLRQALTKLESEGLVVSRAHIGATVAPLSLAQAEDVYASRSVLEPMLLRAAAPRLHTDAISYLKTIIDRQNACVSNGDRQELLRLDRVFHQTMYEKSSYETSVTIVDRLRDLSDRYVARFQNKEGRPEKVVREHGRILQALESGDIERASNELYDHIQDGINNLRYELR